MTGKKKSIYKWLIILALIGFVILLFTSRETLKETWQVLTSARLELILLLPVIQFVNYFFIGGYYRNMFGNFGAKIKRTRAWGVVAAMNFVNQILPSGGLSGITYLAYGFRAKVSVGKTTMIQMGRYVFAFLAYAIIGPIAYILLIQGGESSKVQDIINKIIENPIGIVVAIAFFALIIFLIIFLRNKEHALSLLNLIRRAINWAGRIFNKKDLLPEKVIKNLVNEFHEGIEFISEQRSKIIIPAGFMLLSVFMELMIVYTSLKAVGAEVTFAATFASFVAANIVGVISIIPGDVGVHEAVVITMLVIFGVPAPVALSATLLYRVFNKMIFLPIGFYFYSAILKPATNEVS